MLSCLPSVSRLVGAQTPAWSKPSTFSGFSERAHWPGHVCGCLNSLVHTGGTFYMLVRYTHKIWQVAGGKENENSTSPFFTELWVAVFHSFISIWTPLSISFRVGLEVPNSFNCVFYGNVLILPSFWRKGSVNTDLRGSFLHAFRHQPSLFWVSWALSDVSGPLGSLNVLHSFFSVFQPLISVVLY